MSLDAVLSIEPGEGRLIRLPSAAVFIDDQERAKGFIEAALGATGRVLQAVQEHILEREFEAPAVVGVEWTDSDVVIMLFGDIAVRTSARTAPSLSASGAGTWIEHRTPINQSVEISSENAAPLADTSLGDGVVPSGGFSLKLEPSDPSPVGAPERQSSGSAGPKELRADLASETQQEPRTGNEMNVDSVDYVARPGASELQADRKLTTEPTPVSNDRVADLFGLPSQSPATAPLASPFALPSEADSANPSDEIHGPEESQLDSPSSDDGPAVLVDGRRCQECGVVNRPISSACSRCGSASLGSVEASPRPVICRLELDDGRIVSVDSRVVLGRTPDDGAGSVAVSLEDDLVSGTHAAIELDGWNIRVVDLGSTNGTSVRNAFGPTVLEPGIPHSVEIDDEIGIGGAWLRVLDPWAGA